MRDIELEEGEAYSPHNDDDENIDLDKDFSYIDWKLENILGHYQKDFTNGYSAKRVGPIFGVYGSFLPMQERSPAILLNQKTQSHISSKCPPDLPSENPNVATNISLPSRTVTVLSNQPASEIFTVDNKLKVKNSAKCASHHEQQPKQPLFPRSEKNSLKFRVKVAPKSDLSRDNTATIYSDLGLDMSPSTSTEGTPLDNENLTGLQKMNLESPTFIVKIMTSITLPNEALVSPLHADLISLTELKNTLETYLPALNIVNDSGYLDGKEAMDEKKTKPMDTTNEKKAKQGKASKDMNPKQNINMKTSESKTSIVLDKKNEIKSLVAKSDNFIKQGQVVEEGNATKITMKTEKDKTVVELTKDEPSTEKRNEFLHREAEEKKPLKECSVVKEEEFNQVCPRKANGYMKESGNHEKIAEDIEVKDDESVTSKQKQKSNVKAMRRQQLVPSFEDASASIVMKKLKGLQTGNVTSTELPRGSVVSSSGVEYGDVICKNIPSRSKTCGIDLPREISKGKVNVIENCSQKRKEVTSREAQHGGRKMAGQVTSKKTAFANSEPNLGIVAGADCLKERDPVGELPPQENASLVPLEMDDWVQCEKCQKWRLLPFGTNPDSLPKKWICRMLTWLPEMNKCTFTEDETTQALRALYVPSASGPAILAQNDQQTHLDGVAGVKAHNVGLLDLATNADVMVGSGKEQSFTTLGIHTARQSGHHDLHKPIKKDPRHSGGDRSLKNLKNNPKETALASKFATGADVPSKVPKKRAAEVEVSGGFKKLKKVHQQSLASSGPGRLLPLELKGGSQNYNPDTSQISWEFVHRSSVCPPLKVKIRGRSEMAGIIDEVNGVNDVSEKKRKLKDQASRKIDEYDARKSSENARDLSLSDNATTSSSSKVATKVKLKAREGKSSPVRSMSSSPLKVCKPDPDKRTNRIVLYNEPKELSSRKGLKSRAEGAFASNEFVPRSEEIKPRKSNLSRTAHDDQSSKEGSAGRPSNIHRVDAQRNVEGRDGKLDHIHSEKEPVASKQNPEIQMPNESQFDGTSLDIHNFHVTEMGPEKKSSFYSDCIPGFEKGNGSNSLRIDNSNEKLTRHGLDDHVNLRHHGHTMQNSKDIEASSSKKKDSLQWAVTALKEARDLKHSANRLKTAGSGFSTGLFFQAALKFLHGASLLEPQNSENGRNGEMSSTDVYSSTAKLCEYCAHEYEKCNDMASAALAYKCMEVAYMRVVYNSDVAASRDRVELQMAVRDTPQVDSPSSSASDIDNLNNQVAIDARDGLSVIDHRNHVIVAENRPNFVRLLSFTRDINLAMEASRRSQDAFAVASPILSRAGNGEGISYIKRVLDFSFHDLDGLLHLTRLAMEALNN